ncbi:MAG: hypothetical protein DWI24_00015 [Planctomycetota bacterium]|nr:MAG: hypothetical protein DWI24_00015 [Planctomycetota bacterium]
MRWHKLLGCSLNEFPLARSSSLLLVGQTFQIGPRQHERVVADGILRPLAAFADGVKAITQVSVDFGDRTQLPQQPSGSLLAAVEGADEMMSRFPNGQSLSSSPLLSIAILDLSPPPGWIIHSDRGLQ